MKYATPAAFKTAVEERIKKRNPSQFARNRQLFIYSRFMARVLAEIGNAAILKRQRLRELPRVYSRGLTRSNISDRSTSFARSDRLRRSSSMMRRSA